MIHEAIATGATIEEAQENAKKALNAPESADVRTEILQMPTKKVLGLFGGSPAKARAPSVSIMMFTHSIWITVTGVSTPMNGPMREIPTAHRFILN